MSRLTFGDQIRIAQDGAGKDTSTASQTFFKRHINSRDNFVVSKLPSHLTEITRTFSTVASQQYYHYPPEIREIESLVITIGSVNYPLKPIHSNNEWARLNALDIQAGAIPLYYYKRQRDVGIYPIPQAVYTGTMEYSLRGGGLVRTDYSTGSVVVTENDATVTEAGTAAWSTLSNVRPGDFFVLTDSNGEPRGSWYRISSVTSAVALELESVFEESTESTVTYKIGQCSEIPEEYQEIPAYLALGDYFASFRQNQIKAQFWYNMGWTGDGNNSNRKNNQDVSGGLLGLLRDYRDRNSSHLIRRKKTSGDARLKVWASTIS